MSGALKKVAVVAGIVAITFAIPGLGPAIGISAQAAGTIVSVASAVSCSTALASTLKPKVLNDSDQHGRATRWAVGLHRFGLRAYIAGRNLYALWLEVLYSILPRFPWAFGISGSVAPEVLTEELGRETIQRPDDLFCAVPLAMRRAIAATVAARGCDPSHIIIHASGALWDAKAKKAEGFYVTSETASTTGQATEPFAWYEIDWIASSGHPDGLRGYMGRDVDLTDPASFDPRADGLRLLDAQRRLGVENRQPGVTPGFCRIGGEAHLHVVDRHGVHIERLCVWPDRVGEKIAV